MTDRKTIPRVELPEGTRLATLALREGLPPTQWGENSEALFLTSSFVHPDAATAAARFANEEEAFVYSRFTNPTVTMFERRLAALEGMEACIATSSGMSAIAMLVLALLKAGDHVVCSQSVFGSTISLFGRDFAKFGVETTFVSQTDPDAWRRALRPTTKLLFAETPSNPLTEVCDMRALADIAHEAGALLALDNCFCSPALQRPVEFGADIVIHSGTKYLDGQGRVVAGAVCGTQRLIDEKFVPAMRSLGLTLSPFNAWVVLKGLETLGIRMRAQSEAALTMAQWLERQPQVERVYYPGLASHPQHELAMRQQSGSGGAVVSFVVRGAEQGGPHAARANAFKVVDSTRICSITANLGDTKTTITHPSSTSHGRLTEEQRQAAGISQGMLRLAVGLDDVRDLQDDLIARLRRAGRGGGMTAPHAVEVRTRIAPSPTGALHVGTARAALFSWAYARHFGGTFILRIEDTDLARSTQSSVDSILQAMQWLGFDADEGPYFQMQRIGRYREVIGQMLDAGTAYRCWCTPGRARRDARGAAGARREAALRRPLAPRAGQAAARAAGRRAAGGAVPQSARRRGALGRPDQGADRDRQPRTRRSGDRPRRRRRGRRHRHADLQLLRRRRRFRHAHHARHPRRRPCQQHAAADQHPARARRRGRTGCRSTAMRR